MDRGAWCYGPWGGQESDMTEHAYTRICNNEADPSGLQTVFLGVQGSSEAAGGGGVGDGNSGRPQGRVEAVSWQFPLPFLPTRAGQTRLLESAFPGQGPRAFQVTWCHAVSLTDVPSSLLLGDPRN